MIWTVEIEDHGGARLGPIVVRTVPLGLLLLDALIKRSSCCEELMLAVNECNKIVLNFRFLGPCIDFMNKETPAHNYHRDGHAEMNLHNSCPFY